MKTLIVDDDYSCRRILQAYLLKHGACDLASNGSEAIDKFKAALIDKEPYDLICLDIMMPEIDGHEVLQTIRKIEENEGIYGSDNVKIIMTTALSDTENIVKSFKEQSEAYIIKPIEDEKLVKTLKYLELI